MLESLVNKFADLNSEILLNERLHHRYFSIKKFYLRNTFLTAEAVVWRCSIKKVFLEISQNLQDNTCVRKSFSAFPKACNFIKKDSLTQVFSCEFWEISENTFFTEYLRWLLLWQDLSGRLLLLLKKLSIQTFNSKHLISNLILTIQF